MEIKYEAVFGDQGIFDAQSDCEMVGNGHYKIENGIVKVWNFTEKQWADNYKQQVTIVAMRRIIRTPTWTVEDKKAGKLPEVGSMLNHKTKGECTFIGFGVDNKIFWALKLKNDLIYITYKKLCTPIESPEEKAAQLRDEWLNKSLIIFEEEGFIGLHDALLSGELPVPVKG